MQGYIQSGIDEGAQLLAGGLGLPDGVTKGYFVRPTVFADVKPGMTIEKEEIFGPVLCMMPFDDEAHAVRIANDTPYGLTNYVRRLKHLSEAFLVLLTQMIRFKRVMEPDEIAWHISCVQVWWK